MRTQLTADDASRPGPVDGAPAVIHGLAHPPLGTIAPLRLAEVVEPDVLAVAHGRAVMPEAGTGNLAGAEDDGIRPALTHPRDRVIGR